jgi:hypothetical protein
MSVKTKKAAQTAQDIEAVATDFQALARAQKELDAKIKPLKAKLLAHAEANKAKFDEAFQLKFGCGAYVSLRVKDVIEGHKDYKFDLLTDLGSEYADVKLDEEKVIAESRENSRISKLLTKHFLHVVQKETLAVYAQ